MVDVLMYQIAAFLGSVLAVVFGTIAPYYKKWTETKEITGEPLVFDKKFAVSAGISIVFAFLAGLLSFDTTESSINYNDTVLKTFVAAFLTGVALNLGINSFMKPSTSLISVIKKQNNELKRLLSKSSNNDQL